MWSIGPTQVHRSKAALEIMCYYLNLDDIVSVERAHHHPNVQGAWQALPYFLGNRIRYHDAPHALWSSHVVYLHSRRAC